MTDSAEALSTLRSQLDDARAKRGLTLTQLARAAGLGRTVVSQAFSSSAPPPTKATVCALAMGLRLPTDPLLALLATAVGSGGRRRPNNTVGQPISDWKALDLDVHPAAPAPFASPDSMNGDAGLPGYVRRPHDEALARVVAAAATGRSQMAVLIGSSSTGKTRACWEAILPLVDEGWLLWHPFDPTRSEAALNDLERVGPRTVVWLNEAQHYLGVGQGRGERVAAALATLLADPGRRPVLVLGTLWPEYADRYMAMPRPGQLADPHAQVRTLIANRRIAVPDKFDAAAMNAAQALADAGDQQMAAALHRAPNGRLTQDLAGGPELLHRYHGALSGPRAVLQAAMDALRLGISLHLPLAFLQYAAEDYFTDAEYDALPDDWFEQALADLARPVHGNLAPLRRIRIRDTRRLPGQTPSSPQHLGGGPAYRLADYLEEHGRHERRLACPPTSFWQAAHDHITASDDLAQLAQAALHRYRLYWAFYLQQASGVLGPTGGGVQTCVVRMRETAGDFKGVDALVRREVDSGSVWALIWLAASRENAGDRDGAEHLLREAADTGHIGALVRLLALRKDAGDMQEVEILTRQIIDATGSPENLLPSMHLRTGNDELKGANRSKRLAPCMGYIWVAPQRWVPTEFAADGSPIAVTLEAAVDGAPLVSAQSRWSDDDPSEAESLAQQAAETVDAKDRADALAFLAYLREKGQELDQAEAFARQAAELGRSDVLVDVALKYSQAGNHEKAKDLLLDANHAGDPYALVELVNLLRTTGYEEEAEIIAQQVAEASQAKGGNYLWLAHLQYRAGRIEEAKTMVLHAADAGAFAQTFYSDGLEPWLRDGAEPWLIDSMTAWWPQGIDPDGTPSPLW